MTPYHAALIFMIIYPFGIWLIPKLQDFSEKPRG